MVGGHGVYTCILYITLLDNYNCDQFYACKHSKLSIQGREGMGPQFPFGSAPGLAMLSQYTCKMCVYINPIMRYLVEIEVTGSFCCGDGMMQF